MSNRGSSSYRPTESPDILFVIPWFGIGLTGGKLAVLGGEFPFSIVQLMTRVENNGFTCEIVDLNLEREPLAALERAVRRLKPKIVGITSYSATIVNAEAVAKRVKQIDENIPVILGGFHASALPGECLTLFEGFDFVMHGESELCLPILLGRILNHEPVSDTPNLGFRDGGQVVINPAGPIIQDLDEQPFPLIEKAGFHRYRPSPPNYYTKPTIGLMASRGCPFKCTFCATHFHWNKTVRRMSRGLLVDWLEKFGRDWGIKDFRFYDDTFTTPRREIVEFCEEVLRRGLAVHWNCYSRVDTIDEPLARLMKRAGCYHVKFGIEAGTEKSLKRIKKNITLKRIREAVAEVHRIGMETKASFILGIHDETMEDSLTTLELALELPLDYATFSIMMIFPGSEDYETWKGQGRIPPDFRWDKPLYTTPHDLDQYKRLLKTAFRRFYFRPQFFLRLMGHWLRNPLRQSARYLDMADSILRKKHTDF